MVQSKKPENARKDQIRSYYTQKVRVFYKKSLLVSYISFKILLFVTKVLNLIRNTWISMIFPRN